MDKAVNSLGRTMIASDTTAMYTRNLKRKKNCQTAYITRIVQNDTSIKMPTVIHFV